MVVPTKCTTRLEKMQTLSLTNVKHFCTTSLPDSTQRLDKPVELGRDTMRQLSSNHRNFAIKYATEICIKNNQNIEPTFKALLHETTSKVVFRERKNNLLARLVGCTVAIKQKARNNIFKI